MAFTALAQSSVRKTASAAGVRRFAVSVAGKSNKETGKLGE